MSLLHDIVLVHSPHWSPNIAKQITKAFPQREKIFSTTLQEATERLLQYPQWVEDFFTWKESISFEVIQENLKKRRIFAIGQEDARYPELLKHIHAPPLILFVQGNLPEKIPWCAIVGSRSATSYGKLQALRFGKECAEHKQGVVSGLAYGIDECAVQGACKAGGAVAAVLAGGHETLGKREKEMRDFIIAHGGALITEHPPTFTPQPYHFPIRNRIIAGIAERTLVIEAKQKSGSLITAYNALKENRSVFALPGQITSKESEGCHALLKEGAGLCTSIFDFLEIPPTPTHPTPPLASGGVTPLTPSTPLTPHTPTPTPHTPTPFHQKLWEKLKEPQTFDLLVDYMQEKASEVAGILNIWEIEGYLALKNGRYSRAPYEHPSYC